MSDAIDIDIWCLPTTKVCNYSFVEENDSGKKLLKCSRCSGVFYVDQKSQKKHWPMHKKVCCSLEKDDPRVRLPFANAPACLKTIQHLLKDPLQRIKGRLLLHALQEFKRFYAETDLYASNPEKVTLELYHAIFGPLSELQRHPSREEIFGLIFAIPGFCSFFLSDDTLLSSAMKELKQKNQPAPSEERDYFSRENQMLKLAAKKGLGYYLSPAYTGFVNMLFFNAAFHDTTGRPWQGGTELAPDPCPLAVALIRRTMKWWCCEYTRVSFPSISIEVKPFSVRSETLFLMYRLTFFNRGLIQKWMKEDEYIPGLTIKQIISVLIKDKSFFKTVPDDGKDFDGSECIITTLFDREEAMKPRGPWKFLSAADRIELMDLTHDWDYPSLRDFPGDILTVVQSFVLGFSGSMLLEMNTELNERSTPAHAKTAKRIRGKYDSLMAQLRPQVEIYVDIVEPKYQKAMKDQNMMALPFPEDVILQVGEYLFPKDVFYFEISGPGAGY